MKLSLTKTMLLHFIQAFWAALILLLFVLYSGKISHIYGSSLNSWDTFPRKLVEIEILSSAQNLFLALTGAIYFTIGCISLGSIITSKLWLTKNLSITAWFCNLITTFLVGEIIYSFILFGMGIAKILSPTANNILLISFIFFGVFNIKNIFLSFQDRKKSEINTIISKSENLIIWLSISIILSTLLFTSARLSYDSVAVYFSNAKLTAITHQIQSYVDDAFFISSFHTGILYSAIIQLYGDQAARVFSWINGVFIIILSLGLAEKNKVGRAGKIATFAMLATSTAFIDLFGDGKIELASTLPILAAIYWLISANGTRSNQDLLFVGIFSGFAMIARPYNAILLGGFIGFFYIASRETLISRIKSISWIAGPIVFLLAAHFALNWIILGDPLAPINNTLKVNTNVWQWSFDPNQIWTIRFFYPLATTFINTAQSLGNTSPLIIVFLPTLLLKKNKSNSNLSKSLAKIFIIAAATLTLWIVVYFTVLEIRYVLFLWIIIYIAFSERISLNIEQTGTVNKTISNCILITLLLFIVVRNIFIAVDAYAPINKSGIPQCGDFIFCNFLKPINEAAKPGERILALNAYRYYLRPELFACSSKNTDYVKIRDASLISNEAFWTEVHHQGYTYIAYERNYAVRHLYMNFSPNPENTPSWVQLNQLEDDMNGSFVSYKIEYINPPYKAEKQCSQNSGVWLVENIP